MSAIDPTSLVTGTMPAREPLLSFAGADFQDTLQLGQIIKGRVLRHFEGSRYLVDFSGQEKVVDSGVPLTANEIIHGRVVGIGERVELARIRTDPSIAMERSDSAAVDVSDTGNDPRTAALLAHLREYRAALSAADLQRVVDVARTVHDVRQLALGAAILHKLGLTPIDADMLAALHDVLPASRLRGESDQARAIGLQFDAQPDAGRADNAAFVGALAEAVRALAHDKLGPRSAEAPGAPQPAAGERYPAPGFADGPEADAGGPDSGESGMDRPAIAQVLFNVQSGGAIAHRLRTLPILLDDQLVELDLALFDQRESQPGQTRHRQAVFSLELDQVGAIEIRAATAGNHVRIAVTTDSRRSTEEMALHAGELRAGLQAFGWEVDALQYETRIEGGADTVRRTVVEHLIAHDSLDRVI